MILTSAERADLRQAMLDSFTHDGLDLSVQDRLGIDLARSVDTAGAIDVGRCRHPRGAGRIPRARIAQRRGPARDREHRPHPGASEVLDLRLAYATWS